ncbi:MAG TPA: TVP38/TMEM64 family protein [Candidatus Onthocola stercoravium]|nr:TVP38/TMEM64 family protein [Candidatus Onthocola stercoravium]
MGEVFSSFYNFIMDTIDAMGVYGPLLGSLFIVLESIIPPLPLFVFITINFIAFGYVLGFIISWVCTIIGCLISYFLVKKFLRNFVVDKIKNVDLLTKCMNYIENLSLTKVTVILSIPFTPAFMMNIAAGLVNMNFKKFFIAILISKIFLVYFWGFVGTSLVESFQNPTSLITVVVMMVIAYVMSLVIKKVFKID